MSKVTTLLRLTVAGALGLVFASACSAPPSAPESPLREPAAQLVADAAVAPPAAIGLPTRGIVAAFYEQARAAGVAVLREGGTATDAFVAITLVDYVCAPGVTSLAGPLGALVVDGKTGEVESLDATFDAVHDPKGLYDPTHPSIGASVLVPGALRGLEALWKAKGKLPWRRLVEPARLLAEGGFVVDTLYASVVASREDTLARSAYGRATFLPGATPLAAGSTLKQPQLASFLAEVADLGSAAMYEGAWAQSFVDEVRAAGGAAALTDLSSYEAKWHVPWTLDIDGMRVFANAGRAYGGVYGLLGLSVLAHDDRDSARLTEVDRLDVRLRTARALYDDPWFFDAAKLDNPSFVRGRLADTASIWSAVRAKIPAQPKWAKGTHSLHVTVIDAAGNAITGTNTINSLPWGSGLFVRGVPLTDAGATTDFVPGPGERVVSPLTLHVVKRGDVLQFIGGTFGSSLLETGLQLIADVTLERTTASTMATRHRFGTFLYDSTTNTSDPKTNTLDPATPDALTHSLTTRGLQVQREPHGDNGWGTFIHRDPTGNLTPISLDTPWFRGGTEQLP